MSSTALNYIFTQQTTSNDNNNKILWSGMMNSSYRYQIRINIYLIFN